MIKIVHISGYTLGESKHAALDHKGNPTRQGHFGDWNEVCWGNTKTLQLGRIPMALSLARAVKADKIIWSTGATSRAADGKSEAAVMLERAYEGYVQLIQDFRHRFSGQTWRHEHTYWNWLRHVSLLDERSKNTSESMNVLRQMLWEIAPRGSVMVYLVSSANHTMRVLRDAELAFDIGSLDSRFAQRVTLCAVPAETNYGERTVQHTIVDDRGTMYVPKSSGVHESE